MLMFSFYSAIMVSATFSLFTWVTMHRNNQLSLAETNPNLNCSEAEVTGCSTYKALSTTSSCTPGYRTKHLGCGQWDSNSRRRVRRPNLTSRGEFDTL